MINTLHCIAIHEGDYWSARCLDFTLYAVGDTREEAKSKLYAQIDEYLYDAFEGEDKEFATELLLRKAPLKDWIIYHAIDLLACCAILKGKLGEIFKPAIPHRPYHHA
jgi:hypothetical protein